MERKKDTSGAHEEENVAQLTQELYRELRAIAARHLGSERSNHTLQPTALVHEAYVLLSQQDSLKWNDRKHFLRIASRQIRRILVDHARTRGADKRGGNRRQVTLATNLAAPDETVDLLELDDALNQLDRFSPHGRELVELKFFGGLTEPEIASVLGISERTLRRRWLFARSWLYRELGG